MTAQNFHAEGAVYAAEAPPALPDGEGLVAVSRSGGEGGEAGEQMGAQELQDAGDGDEDGDALAADEVGSCGRVRAGR